jgi:hypothetical protein
VTITTDSKKRVVIPWAKPGDVFDCVQQDENHIALAKLIPPPKAKKRTRAQVRRAIMNSKMQPIMPWDELRKLTREP